MASELPALSRVFVNERDIVLTNSLMVAANCVQEPYGRPVNVVGVVGMGHVAGIKELWLKEESRDVTDLLIIPSSHWTCRLLWGSLAWAIQTLFTVGLYWLGRIVFSSIGRRLTSIFGTTPISSSNTTGTLLNTICVYCHRQL